MSFLHFENYLNVVLIDIPSLLLTCQEKLLFFNAKVLHCLYILEKVSHTDNSDQFNRIFHLLVENTY